MSERRQRPKADSLRRLLAAEETVGLAVLDSAGRIRFANAALARLSGKTPPALLGQRADTLFVAAVRPAVTQMIETALAGTAAPEAVAVQLDNPAQPADAAAEAWCRPLRGEPGALLRVTDVTERRRIEARLEEGARLQAVGRLAGGIAHDFNNLLATISAAAEAALARGADAATADDLRHILDSAGRGARLVRQLLAFASQQPVAPRTIALAETVAQTVPLLRRLLGGRHALLVECREPIPWVRLDPTQLDQALLNLVVNAREAMAAGGTIRLCLEGQRLLAPWAEAGGVVPPGEWAVVTVSDTGCGIAPEHLPSIFEPFFTTRREAGGTGLGLSTVVGIMRQAGGYVTVSSRLGEGTAFRLWFPAVAEGAGEATPTIAAPATPAAPAEGLAARANAQPGKMRRILLVEDEAPLRRLTERALRAAGHEVVVAEDAEAALTAVDEGFVPEVLISDVTMPGEMDGLALAETLRARLPHLGVVLISGYAVSLVTGQRPIGKARLLAKPFLLAELLAAVTEAGSVP